MISYYPWGNTHSHPHTNTRFESMAVQKRDCAFCICRANNGPIPITHQEIKYISLFLHYYYYYYCYYYFFFKTNVPLLPLLHNICLFLRSHNCCLWYLNYSLPPDHHIFKFHNSSFFKKLLKTICAFPIHCHYISCGRQLQVNCDSQTKRLYFSAEKK